MRFHKDVKKGDSSWTMQPQKNDVQPHIYLQPSQILQNKDSPYVMQPDGYHQTQGRSTISSDKRGNGSCFWGKACGEGAAHNMRVTRVYTTVSPASVKFSCCIDRLYVLDTQSPSLQLPPLLQMCVVSCTVEAMRLRL